ILSGLLYLHNQRIIHGNLFSKNIWRCHDGSIVLEGFKYIFNGFNIVKMGLSEHLPPPETMENVSFRGNKVDIWNFGMIYLEMLVQPTNIFSQLRHLNDDIIKSLVESSGEFEFLTECLVENPLFRPSAKE